MDEKEIKSTIYLTRKALSRGTQKTVPLRDHWREIAKHIGLPGHACTVALDEQGCQLHVCHYYPAGVFILDREEMPDPFMFDHVTNPREFLARVFTTLEEKDNAKG